MKIAKGTMSAGARTRTQLDELAGIVKILAEQVCYLRAYESQSINLTKLEDDSFEALEELAHFVEEMERKDELDAKQREEIRSLPVRSKAPSGG